MEPSAAKAKPPVGAGARQEVAVKERWASSRVRCRGAGPRLDVRVVGVPTPSDLESWGRRARHGPMIPGPPGGRQTRGQSGGGALARGRAAGRRRHPAAGHQDSTAWDNPAGGPPAGAGGRQGGRPLLPRLYGASGRRVGRSAPCGAWERCSAHLPTLPRASMKTTTFTVRASAEQARR